MSEREAMGAEFVPSHRDVEPDPRFNSKLATKFINCLMHGGKKSVATKIFYEALELIGKRMSDVEPYTVFAVGLENVKPHIEVRSKRVGGATYQVPTPVSPRRRQALGIRWMLEAVRGKKGRPTANSLADELMAAYKREGTAFTKRDNVHRMADANKAFSHFA
ncbi:MAG: 30S ribosomal protein S7 [Planctomycetota bacterium]|nr:30S ribosomal protein S7 [Planctomycetota bacterium]MDA1164176.1 30S ribosomal protein S7 [Planctomycetota bacterium]